MIKQMEVPSFLKAKHLPVLDGLRAFSIFFVVVAHFNLRTIHSNTLDRIFKGGGLGVQIFFVISGFLITILLLKEQIATHTISLSKFYIRRFLRILPVAFLFLIVLFAICFWLDIPVGRKNLFHLVTFTENFNNNDFLEYGHHYWSLSIEEQFYFVFPFFIKRNLRLYFRMSLGLILMAPLISFAYTHFHATGRLSSILSFLNTFLNGGLLSILIGSTSAIILFRYRMPMPSLNKFLVSLAQLSCGYFVWYLADNPHFGGLNMIVCAFFISFFLFLSLHYKASIINDFLALKWVVKIGVISYSLYIWQQLFTLHQPWAEAFKGSDSILLNSAALLIVALVSYQFYEKKFLALKSRFQAETGPGKKRNTTTATPQ